MIPEVIALRRESIQKRIERHMTVNSDLESTVLLTDLYCVFPDVKPSTIRQALRRMAESAQITLVKPGVYVRAATDRLITNDYYNLSTVYRTKYLVNAKGETIGYLSGINFANSLGLTTQTASILLIRSNAVANKKRNVSIRQQTLIVDSPRVPVTNQNVRLLQVLDLLAQKDAMVECDDTIVKQRLTEYLRDVILSGKDVEATVERYPLIAQRNFYKIGLDHVFA